MTLKDKIARFLGHHRTGWIVETDPDPEFSERVGQLEGEQQKVENRLRALGTTVDVRLRRIDDEHVKVEVETENED